MKDDQATCDAFSFQKRTSRTTKPEFFLLFSFFVLGHCCPPGSESSRPKSMRIQIHNTAYTGTLHVLCFLKFILLRGLILELDPELDLNPE
jgi:hypothetical protein